MPVTPELLDELNTLLRFDLDTNQQGIKIHHDAPAAIAASAQRLHDKGLITQIDGGYLTPLGRHAAEHAQTLISILTTSPGLGNTP
ncbi:MULTISPECIES: TIGR02647 family protein [Uliginosibacterium]|uniref:TIGR02647 family protein n=1 Tax=Uliginosibacterium aquaticum TaxID=2731212 RepID=A0ABX2IPR1_9RHOO|nr:MULTISPECIES: TIGR02647 family protein [Uliginosibacterium]MDO6387247.1 TIGR02647 family protein [Uliginosibacterium sp. 31-12]NSL55990.1 TIGR02647 family protein [Uliginosibacterium aquaticum]PLK50738.1 TIGR02647 family protein [Uliginosibacterium sp. TH139]